MSEVHIKVERELDAECDESTGVENPSFGEEPQIKTEFVEIKIEPGIQESIKTEPPDPDSSMGFMESVDAQTEVQKVFIKIEPVENGDSGSEPEIIMDNQGPLSPQTILPDFSDVDFSVSASNLIQKVDGTYPCPICNKKFVTRCNVQRHLAVHDREIYKCTHCTREFSNKKFYDKHMYLHSLEKKYGCDKCNKKFRTQSNLEQHKKSHSDVKQFPCDICERPFSIRGNMLKHRARHDRKNVEPLTCSICGKIFDKEYLLKTHMEKHSMDRPFSCDICLLNFKHKSTLMRHVQVHKGLMPYSCKICLKRFTHEGLIKPHMRKHTGEKPFQCRMCKRLFAHKHNMMRHELRHSKVKNLVCHICNKVFPRESRLKYHMRTHTKEKLFSCDVCFRNFSHKQNVIRHYDRKHPNMEYKITKHEEKIEEVE